MSENTLLPHWSSIKRPLGWFAFFCTLLSIFSLAVVADSPRGIDLNAFKLFIGIPWGMLFLPLLLIFLSYKIKLSGGKIAFYILFLPVKTISLREIQQVRYENVAANGQRNAMVITYSGGREYIYPVRLFEEDTVKNFIRDLNHSCSG